MSRYPGRHQGTFRVHTLVGPDAPTDPGVPVKMLEFKGVITIVWFVLWGTRVPNLVMRHTRVDTRVHLEVIAGCIPGYVPGYITPTSSRPRRLHRPRHPCKNVSSEKCIKSDMIHTRGYPGAKPGYVSCHTRVDTRVS